MKLLDLAESIGSFILAWAVGTIIHAESCNGKCKGDTAEGDTAKVAPKATVNR